MANKRINKDRPLTLKEHQQRNAERRRLPSDKEIAERIEAIGQREDEKQDAKGSNLLRDWNLIRVYRAKKI